MEIFAGNNLSTFQIVSQALKLGWVPAYKTIFNISIELEQAQHQILSNNERNGA